MKKIKYVAIILAIIMSLNIIIPNFSLAIEEVQNELDKNITNNDKEETIENEKKTNESIENKEEETEETKKTEENENNDKEVVEENNIDKTINENRNVLRGVAPQEESEEVINYEEFSVYINDNNNKINSYNKDGVDYLFVPKNIDLSNLVINYTGNIKSIDNAEFNEVTKQITGVFQNESALTIELLDGQIKNVIIMQSDVPAIFINLNNDVSIENVNNGSKDTKYSGLLNVTGCDDNKNNISQSEIEFKGRGNTTWAMPKRGYQIKFNKKTNFLGIGNSKEKKWVLIANYQDPTLLKNKIVNDLCVKSGLSNCPNCLYADLYVNGEYVGNYLVCDKIEIKSNRVNLVNEKGVLVELDNAYYQDEDYYFQSKRGDYYAIKEAVADGNDILTKQAMESFKNALNAFEDELYSENPSWNKISKMIDVESFAKYYLINEFAKNPDSYYSSCYLYKDGDVDVIHMGPTWDYDAAFGAGYRSTGEQTDVDFTINFFRNEMQRLYTFPEFANLVNEVYIRDIKPNLNNIDVNLMSENIKKSSKINAIVWSSDSKYNNLKQKLNTFVENRKLYYNKRYSNAQIEYSTHVENNGWTISKRNGISGTEGQSLRVEGFKIEIGSGYDENISLSYRAHVQNIGWQNWVSNGKLSGTTGQSLQVEAIQIKLKNSSKYSIRYRVHIQDIGWQEWKYDGEVAGTTGKSKRIEAIEIQIIEGRNRLGSNDIDENSLINYRGHIQDIGNTGYGANGDIIGTMGRGLRLEGLEIKLNKTQLPNTSLSIDAHVQDIGWIKGLTDKQFIGTEGKSLRIEALSFKLVGENSENYTIRYRVHIQDIGWQSWKENGKIAGTEGQAKRIEAIQIEIVPSN